MGSCAASSAVSAGGSSIWESRKSHEDGWRAVGRWHALERFCQNTYVLVSERVVHIRPVDWHFDSVDRVERHGRRETSRYLSVSCLLSSDLSWTVAASFGETSAAPLACSSYPVVWTARGSISVEVQDVREQWSTERE